MPKVFKDCQIRVEHAGKTGRGIVCNYCKVAKAMFLCIRFQTKLGVGMRKIIYLLFAFMPICVYASSCPSGFIAITEEYLTLEDYMCEAPLREMPDCAQITMAQVCYIVMCAENQYLENEKSLKLKMKK